MEFYAPSSDSEENVTVEERERRRHHQREKQKHSKEELERTPLALRYACPSPIHTLRNKNEYPKAASSAGDNRANTGFLPNSTYSMYAAAMHHLYFVPQAKLIFCAIPEVGIGKWQKFFRFVFGAGDYLSVPYTKTDREEFFISRLPTSKADQLWNDPSWTRAVFFRDPAERLLEAYMDKIVKERYTQFAFHITDPQVLSFPEFIDLVTTDVKTNATENDCSNPRGLHWCTDPHWRPQIMTCAMHTLLPDYDFDGRFDLLSKHTEILLRKVGLWEDYGRVYDDGLSTSAGRQKDHVCWKRPPPSWTTHLAQRRTEPTGSTSQVEGANRRYSDHDAGHGFNQHGPFSINDVIYSESPNSTFRTHYTDDLLANVREAYALDYAIWDDLKSRPMMDVAKGTDMRSVRDYCNMVDSLAK